jgi:hypothetical protein
MGSTLRAMVLSIAMLILVVPTAHAPAVGTSIDPQTWTIMVYMAGNASPELPWARNLNEMEAATQNPWTSVIALVDPFGGNNSTMYQIEHDPNGMNSLIVSHAIDDGGTVIPTGSNNANMGSSHTLSSFIEFAAANFHADRYVLVLWGHGADWYGLCPDGTDILTLPELRTALAESTAVLGRPLDLVAVDACAEATLEMFFEVHEYVRFFVASEKDVPSQGLPYVEILNDLAADSNRATSDFAKTIADDYVDWSRNNSAYSATMSVFNLSAMGEFIERFDSWVRTGIWFEGLFHSELQTAFNSSERYETEWQHDFGGMLSHALSSDIPVELQKKTDEVLSEFLRFRVYSRAYDNPDAVDGVRAISPTGCVVYCPTNEHFDQTYADLQISSHGWCQYSHMLRRIADSNLSIDVPALSYGKTEDFGEGLFDTITLRWPSSHPELDVWVFREETGGLVFSGEFSSSGDNITIHDSAAIGDLIVSASAGANGSAVSYSRIGPVQVTGQININVTLTGLLARNVTVHFVIKSATGTVHINATEKGDHVFSVTLLTPRDVRIGDEINIIVDTGRMNGTGSLVLTEASANMTIPLSEKASLVPGWLLTLVMTLMAATFILIFAVLLRRENKKHGV